MRLTIDQHDLQSALSVVSRAVKGHPTLPTLGGVLMRAEGDRLHLTGTDMELTIEAKVTARVEEAGAVILPGRPLLEIAKKLPGGDVTIAVDDNHNATVTCGRATFRLHGMAPRLFPTVPPPDGLDDCGFTPGILKEVLRRTTFAVSQDETRPVLTGVALEIDGNRMQAIATDGYRVAICTGSLDKPAYGQLPKLVVPGRALAEVSRLLGDAGTCWLNLKGTHVQFRLGNMLITSRLIDSQYPDVLSLLPSEYPHRVRVQRQELLEALQRAALVSQGSGSKYLVRVDIAEDRITITASDPELGEAREEVPAQLQGEGMTIGFNARYLIDGLKVIGSEDVEIGLTGPLQAAQIRGVDEEGFQYIVLPVKLGESEGVPF